MREIAPEADAQARNERVSIDLESASEQVQMGMSAQVSMAQSKVEQGLRMPLTALYSADGQTSVWVVKDGAVSRVSISIGQIGEDSVWVTGGLIGGEDIVTAGVQKLHEGDRVRMMAGEGQ